MTPTYAAPLRPCIGGCGVWTVHPGALCLTCPLPDPHHLQPRTAPDPMDATTHPATSSSQEPR